MDDADRADAEIEGLLNAGRTRAGQAPKLLATGNCHNCGEPAKGAAFCSTECRDDWERRRAAALRLGQG